MMDYIILLPLLIPALLAVAVSMWKIQIFDRDYWKRPMLDYTMIDYGDGKYATIIQVKLI